MWILASVVNEDREVLAATEDATAIGWNRHAVNTQFVFGLHLVNWSRGLLSFFIRDIAERPQTNGLIEASRNDERPVGGEFHCGDTVGVSDEIATHEKSRLLLTSDSETIFSERWYAASWTERSSDSCIWCSSGPIGTSLWGLIFLRRNNSDLKNWSKLFIIKKTNQILEFN